MRAIVNKQASLPLTVVFVGLFTVAVLTIYTINTFDYSVFHDAAEAVLDGKSPYSINDYYENETQEGTGYYNPPHTIVYVAPFALWGAPVLAFTNITIIITLLVGFGRSVSSTALIILGLLLSPQVVFLAAAVNIPGITTGLGLLLVITQRRGVVRGFGWALLVGRPQDGGLVLVYDAWQAFREHDWYAFVSSIIFVLPTLIFAQTWIANLPNESPTGDTLSPSVTIGVIPTLLFLLFIVAIRLLKIDSNRKVSWRKWASVGLSERYWLLIVILQLLQPYLVFYVLWCQLLLIRDMSARRVGMVLAVNFAAFITFGRGYSDIETTLVVMCVVLFIALIMPRGDAEDQVVATKATSA